VPPARSHQDGDVVKALVTGAAGFIGSHLTAALLESASGEIGLRVDDATRAADLFVGDERLLAALRGALPQRNVGGRDGRGGDDQRSRFSHRRFP